MMYPSPAHIRLSYQLGDDGDIVVHIEGRPRPFVARALGFDRDQSGQIQRVYLDRKIHMPNHHYKGKWRMWGAVSTIIERLST